MRVRNSRGKHLVLGVDLAGSPRRPTGLCLLDSKLAARIWLAYPDEEIVGAALKYRPTLVAIDAPLSLPAGRRSLEERDAPHLRECDRMLLRMGIRVFPPTLGPMRMLTARGIRIRKALEEAGFRVIEVFPGGAQDVLGIPRKKNLEGLRQGLKALGIRGLDTATADELDAATAAYVGLLYLRGLAVEVRGSDGVIVMPRAKGLFPPRAPSTRR